MSDLAAVRRFRAGDSVKHAPTGETWLLACDERDGEIICCGWPETMARASDCTLVQAATDEERVKLLAEVAKPGEASYRRSLARHQLNQESAR